MVKISIIIPAFNQGQYLADAIDSVLTQTVKPHEIIVINDGSQDNSLEIAKEYEKDGIKVINQANKGLASARNSGIMNATGDYILPLDSDDMFYETAVEKITKKIEETNADIVAPSFKCFGLNNQEVILQLEGLTVKSFIKDNRIGYFSAFRRSKALEIGGYSPRMVHGYEDFHFWIDLLKHGATIVTIPEPLVLYRTRENSMITTAQQHHKELMDQIMKDHQDIFEEKHKLSICVPIYGMKNAPYFLRRLFDSLKVQTYKDFEIVIGDNSENNELLNICQEYAINGLYIRYFKNSRNGAAANSNETIKQAKGEIIKILHMDDYLAHPNALKVLIDAFKGGWLATGCLHDDGTIKNPHFPNWNDDIHTGANTIGSPSVIMFSNDKPLLFDEKLKWTFDCDLYKRLHKRYGEPIIVNDLNVIVGLHEGQATNLLNEETKQKEVIYTIKKYEKK